MNANPIDPALPNVAGNDSITNSPPKWEGKHWICLAIVLGGCYLTPKVYGVLKEGVLLMPQMVVVAEKIVQIFPSILILLIKGVAYIIVAKYTISLTRFLIEKLILKVSGHELNIAKIVNNFVLDCIRYIVIATVPKDLAKESLNSDQGKGVVKYFYPNVNSQEFAEAHEKILNWMDDYMDSSKPYPSLPILKKSEAAAEDEAVIQASSEGEEEVLPIPRVIVIFTSFVVGMSVAQKVMEYVLVQKGLSRADMKSGNIAAFYLVPLMISIAYTITLGSIYVLDKATHFITGYDSGAWDYAVKNWINPVRDCFLDFYNGEDSN